MGEQPKMLTRTILVCLLVSLSYQKEIQKNDTAPLQGTYQNPKQEEYLLRSRRSTNLPHRITFYTEIDTWVKNTPWVFLDYVLMTVGVMPIIMQHVLMAVMVLVPTLSCLLPQMLEDIC